MPFRKSFTHIALITLASLAMGSVMLPSSEAFAQSDEQDEQQKKKKRPLLAAGLNFFIPGTGYIYNGQKPLYVTLPMIAGAGGLTYVENFHKFGPDNQTLSKYDQTAFLVLFGSVLTINTGLAIDAFREAKQINGERPRASSRLLRNMELGASPIGLQRGQAGYGFTLGTKW